MHMHREPRAPAPVKQLHSHTTTSLTRFLPRSHLFSRWDPGKSKAKGSGRVLRLLQSTPGRIMLARASCIILYVSVSLASAKNIVVIGAGWGGLSAAHHLSKNPDNKVTVVDAAERPGGLVSDSWLTPGGRRAEAGQHGFWDEYHNIYKLMDDIGLNRDAILTGYAEQGQYSPKGLEAVWPVYRESRPFDSGPFANGLPTGLGQAFYTRFINLPPWDLVTAAPLILAFSEFDDSPEAWEKYDKISFRDLCTKLGVSRRLYSEAFEPMILTGLFAPGEECSAAAALGMAYFFVLKHQTSFDVRWCKGNVGERIFQPWVAQMAERGVEFVQSTRVADFECAGGSSAITSVRCVTTGGRPLMPGGTPQPDASGQPAATETLIEADAVVFAVGAAALNGLVRGSPALCRHAEWRRFANLRGLSVLATRLFLDRDVPTEHTANACWGFDEGVGMTWFDIKRLHAPALDGEAGSVIEVDYYHSNTLLLLSEEEIVRKAKADLDVMLGGSCAAAQVVDAAVVKLPNAVNWYFPGSYRSMPDLASASIPNAYFVGDLVRTRHGSWSQEKAYVTGQQAANVIDGRAADDGVVPLKPDEAHVAAGRTAVTAARSLLGAGDAKRGPSLVDFLF